jgi:hemolysin activation/secretion protein
MKPSGLKAGAALAWCGLLLYAQAAQAASTIDAAGQQGEIIQQRQQQQIQQDRENAQRNLAPGGVDLQTLTPASAPSGASATCHEIQRIDIGNDPHLPPQIQQQINFKFAGHCINADDISQILGLITKSYIERGFISTRAYLPAQDLRSGVLKIVVIEGIVEKFQIDDHGAHSVSVGSVFPGLQGQALKLRDLEQGMDQINRLQSNNATLDVQPGDHPGESLVVVHNQAAFPVHVFSTYDNQGSVSTGQHQGAATVTLDDLAGLNESLSATHRQSVPLDDNSHDSTSDDFNLVVPYGYNTFTLDVNRSTYLNDLTLPSGAIDPSAGNNKISSLEWRRVAFRNQNSRWSLAAALTTKDANNYFDNQYLSANSRKLSLLDVKSALSTTLGPSIVSLDLDYSRGLAAFGAMHDAGNLPTDEPHAESQKITADLHFRLPFDLLGRQLSYEAEVFDQYASTPLYGSEQLLIGGIYSVRGFANNSLSGDNGYYWRNDLSLQQPLELGGQHFSARLFVALDTGWVSCLTPGLPGGRLTGTAAGGSLQWRALSWELFRATALTEPSYMTREPAQTWFRVSASL